MADPALEVLVSTIDALSDGNVGVTLTVGGLVISGEIISESKWMEETENHLGAVMAAAGQDASQGFTVLFRTFRERADSRRSDRDKLKAAEAQGLPASMVTTLAQAEDVPFVHMNRVWFHGAGEGGAPVPGDQRGMWRGRLDDVTGWSLGTLGARPRREGGLRGA